LILDGIEDPQNFGAILRSVDAFGVDGVIIKKRNEVPLNATVAKVSTGAINWVKVAMVSNLSQAIQTLKDHGYWIVASDGSGKQDYDTVDYKSPIGLVVGSEGFGIAPLVLKNSDFIVKIPMTGHVNSLNASVASAILISEIVRSRK
jgi:23S rRNA (guanosine2251-2'-O)-methyltransferase